jgi:Uma2 family endonuclease
MAKTFPHTLPATEQHDAAAPVPEALYHVPKDGRKYELIRGELIVSPAGLKHEQIGIRLSYFIYSFLAQSPIGEVFGSSAGYQLAENIVLSPDVSFVRTERLPGGEVPETFGQFAPDLAVEIVSPHDSPALTEAKVQLYLEHGAQLVWVINPKLRQATVYRADGTTGVVESDGALDGERVLPGFTCRLMDLL